LTQSQFKLCLCCETGMDCQRQTTRRSTLSKETSTHSSFGLYLRDVLLLVVWSLDRSVARVQIQIWVLVGSRQTWTRMHKAFSAKQSIMLSLLHKSIIFVSSILGCFLFRCFQFWLQVLPGCLQGELSGGSVSGRGVDHVELHHIPPAPCPRTCQRRGAGHQQETQLTCLAAEKEETRSV